MVTDLTSALRPLQERRTYWLQRHQEASASGDHQRADVALERLRRYDWLLASIEETRTSVRFVIGGTIREAEDLILRKQLDDCVPIDDPTPLQSVDAPEVVLTGTFIARRDVQAFYKVFKQTHAKHQFVP
jgi:hypothetical protein